MFAFGATASLAQTPSNRAAVSGRGGDVQSIDHYSAEFPEETMRGLPLGTQVETLVLIRRASEGRSFIINYRIGS
jgi:hypothetical protein